MSLRVTFLGTGGALPTTARAPSSVFVNREGEKLLFDCGEGTQRQMMRFSTGFGISHVFLSHLHGDHVLGLPGLIQTWDFNEREEPLTIHAPPGSRRHLQGLIHAAGYDPDFHVRIDEVSPGTVAYRAEEYEVRSFRTEHRTTSVGYALVEDDRPGRFQRERAEELGIPVGPKFSKLHAGESVELEDGRTIAPEQVVGEPRPGRKLVYTGDTRPIDATVDAARSADLLIHDATFTDAHADRARATAHTTARQAGQIAERADAARLALTHISSRHATETATLRAEASEAFGGEVFVADDGDEVEVQFPEKA
ncbi:MAG: ribonuclease Z [Haloferacaceae archaeon]